MSSVKSSVEKPVFIPAALIAALIGLGFLFANKEMKDYSAILDNAVKTNLGWLFLLFGAGLLFFGLWLALGRHGNVKFGDVDEKPEFSTMKWIAMMFTAGIGAGLVTWAFGEPIFYLQTPPFGIDSPLPITPDNPLEPGALEAYEWAHMYPLLHWGLVPWAMYAVSAVPIAYTLYVKRKPYLRISESCEHALPTTGRKTSYRIIDVLIVLGIIAGTTTSLGIGVPLLSALISELTGLENSQTLKIIVLIAWVLLFGTSTLRGLKKGISMLADINMVLAIFIMLIILFVGPTLFILNMTTNSLGLMMDNFFRMILWTDPMLETVNSTLPKNADGGPKNPYSNFAQTWTVFYWAWWLAFAAFVGLFVARISRGRTIRQVILGTMLWGSFGTMTYMAIAGGYALHLEAEGILDLRGILKNDGLEILTAKVAANLPFPKISLFLFIILCTIFYATTMDSAAYICASVCSREIDVNEDPDLGLRIVWIFILFLMALGTVYSNSLPTVMAFTVIGAVPLLPIMTMMCISLVRQLKSADT